MQRRSPEQGLRSDRGVHQQLQFPVLPYEDSVHSWLRHSKLVQKVPRSKRKMAPRKEDDNSQDGLSSVGDHAWEEIDNTSACSENGTSTLSRQLTPMSEHPESFDFGISSFMSNNTSSDERAPDPSGDYDQTPVPPQQEIFTPTASNLRSYVWGSTDNIPAGVGSDSIRSQRLGCIKLEEQLITQKDDSNLSMLSQGLFELTRKEVACVCRDLSLEDQPMDVHLKLPIGQIPLRSSPSFEVLFSGPIEMQSPVLEKLGAILTARFGCNAGDHPENNFSRITAVPVSEFHNNFSPDVVLIDSGGVDMVVSRCRHGEHHIVDGRGAITLSLDPGKKQVTSFDPTWYSRQYALRGDYKLPHLAVVYIPEQETPAEKSTSRATIAFLARHKVSCLIIAACPLVSIEPMLVVDSTLPHLAIQKHEQEGILHRVPIDMATFQAMDASQFNRSLAYSIQESGKRGPSARDDLLRVSQAGKEAVADLGKHLRHLQEDFPGSMRSLWFKWIGQVRGRPVWYSIALVALLVMQITSWILQPNMMLGTRELVPHVLDVLRVSTSEQWATATSMTLTGNVPKGQHKEGVHGLSVRDIGSVASILQNAVPNSMTDKSTYRARVIGDSHVIVVRDDNSNRLPAKRTGKVHFALRRDGVPIVHEVTTVTDHVHVIELPVEDAHGKVNVSAWVGNAANRNETLEVDFGSPWLKISAWLNAAQLVNSSVQDNLTSVMSSLSRVVRTAGTHITSHWRETVHSMARTTQEVGHAGEIMKRHAQQAALKHYLDYQEVISRVYKLAREPKQKTDETREMKKRDTNQGLQHGREVSNGNAKQMCANEYAEGDQPRVSEQDQNKYGQAHNRVYKTSELYESKAKAFSHTHKRLSAAFTLSIQKNCKRVQKSYEHFHQEMSRQQQDVSKMIEVGWRHAEQRVAKFSEQLVLTASMMPNIHPGRTVQDFRRKHLRPFEKRLLHLWWRVQDRPRRGRNEKRPA
jgi:hypothetical protein